MMPQPQHHQHPQRTSRVLHAATIRAYGPAPTNLNTNLSSYNIHDASAPTSSTPTTHFTLHLGPRVISAIIIFDNNRPPSPRLLCQYHHHQYTHSPTHACTTCTSPYNISAPYTCTTALCSLDSHVANNIHIPTPPFFIK